MPGNGHINALVFSAHILTYARVICVTHTSWALVQDLFRKTYLMETPARPFALVAELFALSVCVCLEGADWAPVTFHTLLLVMTAPTL